MRVFLKQIPPGAEASLLLLCFAVTSRSQSMPGYQAPDKAKDQTAVSAKAARGEAPLSKLYGHLKADTAKAKRLAPLKKADLPKESKSDKLHRIGIVRDLPGALNPLVDSATYLVKEGEVRVATVISEGARKIRAQFSDFSLPAGARLFVYSATDPNVYYGPYEGRGPWNDGTFWTPSMPGDQIVIEYTVPAGSTAIGSFQVSKIAHLFKEGFDPNDPAGSCNLDVPPAWANVAKSVALLEFITGPFVADCTGTLLNDSNPNSDAYVLTAHHCISTQTEAQSTTAYWNYDSGDTPSGSTSPGFDLTVTGSDSDFTLLHRGSVISGLFYSGWDAGAVTVGTSITGIHHPNGSHKRISFGTTNGNCSSFLPGPCADYAGVTWSQGVTEGGSSGSGLWTGTPDTAKLVGTLTGGDSSCATPNESDFYGRFSFAYPSIASFLEGTNCVTSVGPTSQNFSGGAGAGSFNVTAPGGCSWTAVSAAPSWITITPPANGSGNGTVNFSVAANNGPQRSASITVGTQVFTITQAGGGPCAPAPISFGQTINATLSTSDCPLDDGSFYDVYSFSATAGTQVSVLMQSGAFDTFLFLNNPDGSVLGVDDDGGGGTNSRIPAASGLITLPTTGTYTIWANSFDPGVTGPYSVTLNGSAPIPRTLTVASLNPNSGVNITVNQTDNNGQNNGTTQFTRTYNQNVTVTLTAPGSVAGGNVFQEWRRDGSTWASTVTTSVTMNADHTMTAVYGPPITHTLTVASLNPSSGVSITVSPNDNSGFSNGTTQFTRTYNHNASVSLTAVGVTPEGNFFKRWLMNGSVFTGQQKAIVSLSSDTTMTAEYSIKPKIYGEENSPNAAAAINSVTFLRGPFQILDPHNFSTDGQTRIIIFTNDLGLTNPPLNDAAVLRVEISGQSVPIEAYGPLTGTPGLTGSYIVVKLPLGLATGSQQLVVWLFGYNSDPKTLTIAP